MAGGPLGLGQVGRGYVFLGIFSWHRGAAAALLPPQEIMALAGTAVVAWLEQRFRPGDETAAAMSRFRGWVQERQAAGALTFDAKGEQNVPATRDLPGQDRQEHAVSSAVLLA